MAAFSTEGLDQLIKQTLSDGGLYEMTAAIRDEFLDSAGDILINSVKAEMAKSPYKVADLSRHIVKQRKISRQGNPWVNVTVNGKNSRGERNATVAFVLNYGRRSGVDKTGRRMGFLLGDYFWTVGVGNATIKIAKKLEELARDYIQNVLSKGA